MLVQMRSIDSIRPYPDNPRDNDDAVEAVAASLREFGFRQPLVVDAAGVIVVGHTRYKAAIALGLSEVPVHVASELTSAQAKAYRIADNQTATLATWDESLLTAELLALQGLDFDLDLIGFSPDELAALLQPEGNAGECDPDDVPTPPDAIARRGDVWQLGRHRLLCGDATDPGDLARLLGETPVDLLLTDPPYNVGYEGKTAARLTIANDAMSGTDYRQFLVVA